MANKLPIPPRLTALIEAGVWPRDYDAARLQNAAPIVPSARVRAMAPDERMLYLQPPPFRTVAEDLLDNERFWRDWGALDQIDPAAALILADFELGSDACVILDYRDAVPPVLRLRWPGGGDGKNNEWVRCARTFDEFVELLGLTPEGRSPV
jgi:hypothetical protein